MAPNREPYTIGPLIIRIRFGVYYTIIIIRNPQNPILIFQALVVGLHFQLMGSVAHRGSEIWRCLRHLPRRFRRLGDGGAFFGRIVQYTMVYSIVEHNNNTNNKQDACDGEP